MDTPCQHPKINYFISDFYSQSLVIWQQFSNIDRTNQFTRGKNGVRLVAYQRAN